MDRFLTIEQAAEMTGLSVRWWRRAISERRLTVVKFGRLVRVPEAEVRALVVAGTRPAERALV